MNYLDTSALIKRFVGERGSDRVDALMAAGEPVATGKIAYAEVHSGLARKRREKAVSERDYRLACGRFESDWQAFVRVELTDEVLRLARDVIRRRGLRAFDALHLASAVGLQARLGEAVVFAAADRKLLAAARAEGLTPLDVESAAE